MNQTCSQRCHAQTHGICLFGERDLVGHIQHPAQITNSCVSTIVGQLFVFMRSSMIGPYVSDMLQYSSDTRCVARNGLRQMSRAPNPTPSVLLNANNRDCVCVCNVGQQCCQHWLSMTTIDHIHLIDICALST